MKFHTISQYSSLSDLSLFGVQQSPRSRYLRNLPGGVELWRALGKVLLVALPLVFALLLVLGAVGKSLESSIGESEERHQLLLDKNIEMLAQRAGMHAPERVSRIAADRLSLYAAAPGQIERIN